MDSKDVTKKRKRKKKKIKKLASKTKIVNGTIKLQHVRDISTPTFNTVEQWNDRTNYFRKFPRQVLGWRRDPRVLEMGERKGDKFKKHPWES